MRATILSISALLAATVFLQVGGGLLGTTVGLRMAVAEFPALVAGAVVSVYFLGYVLGVFYGSRLIEAVGHIRAFAALASVASAATLLHPFLVAPVPWGGLRFVQGFCLAGLAVCTESWLNDRVSNEVRGRILSIYMIHIYTAQGIGQVLLNVPDSTGFGLFVISSVLLSLALVPVAATRVKAPPPQLPSRLPFRALWRITSVGLVGAFIAGALLASFYGLIPYFTRLVGLDAGGTSKFMAAAIAGGLLLQWPIGRLSDRLDRRAVLAIVTSVACAVGLSTAAIVLFSFLKPELLFYLAPLVGACIFTIYPLCIAHTSDHIDSAHLVSATGGLILVYGLGAILGPAVASALMDAIGPAGLFLFIGCLGGLLALFAAIRMARRGPIPAEARDPFQLVPRTSHVSSELDPRGESDQPMFEFMDVDWEPVDEPADTRNGND
ncbi:MAG: MFS transporter [Rhodospirillales bacterium]|nr:MFS transporter [Rhodospirillales bacterium]